jgi:DNA-directed RNA polymerase specialized sigma subunit
MAEICQRYEPLAKRMAYKHIQRPDQYDDLEQVARMGLVVACKTFDIKRWKSRNKDGALRLFACHAVWCVRDEIAAYIAADPNPIRLPTDVVRRVAKLRRIVMRLSQELGRDPTFEEIAAAGVIPKDKYTDPTPVLMHMLAYGTTQIPLDEEFASETMTPEEALIAKETEHELERQR